MLPVLTSEAHSLVARTISEAMAPLYAARIEDLGPGDFVKMKCAACGHDELIPASPLLQGLRFRPATLVLDLEPRLRCQECDTRGKAVASVRWGTNAA
jgi:hypothetical protein